MRNLSGDRGRANAVSPGRGIDVGRLLFGLELAGPYMFLLMAVVGGGVAWGLIELNNIARHAALLIVIAGIVMLVPSVSAATVTAQPRALTFGGLGIIVRAMVAWYLSRGEIVEEFKQRRSVMTAARGRPDLGMGGSIIAAATLLEDSQHYRLNLFGRDSQLENLFI